MVWDISPEVRYFQLIRELQRANTTARTSFCGTHRWPKMARWVIPRPTQAAVQPPLRILSRAHTTIPAQSPKARLIVWVFQQLLLARCLLPRRPLQQKQFRPLVSVYI
jgi:hypothetical protein